MKKVSDSFRKKIFTKETLESSASKKKKNSERGLYEYVPASETEKIPAWRVEKKGVPITSDTIDLNNNEGSGDYCLKVDLKDNPDLTNYRLTVVLNATATDGTPVPTASEYFVFLICDLNVRTD